MKIKPYLNFNGNCAEAITLYEKAFGFQAHVMKYSDAPPSEGYQEIPGTENFVMHACLTDRHDYTVYLSDMPPDMPSAFGNGMSVLMELDSENAVRSAFEVLKEGGKVTMELQPTFWSKCFGSLEDKFGVNWMLAIAEE